MEGREDVEDDERPESPSTSKTKGYVRKDRRLSIRMIAEMANMGKVTERQILHGQLNMRKICAKMVPRNLTQEQKEPEKHLL
jgi:hypothetical protein